MKLRTVWKKIKIGFRKAVRGRKKAPKKTPRISAKKSPILIAESGEVERLPARRSRRRAEIVVQAVSPLDAIFEFSGVQLSPHTQRAYKKDMEDFFAYLRTQDMWKEWGTEVDPILVANYRNHLVDMRKLAKATVTRKIAVVKSFFKWASARGWVDRNPAELVRTFPQTQESKTGFLGDVEITQLLGHYHAVDNLGLTDALSKVATETLLMLGVRRSEACQIRVGDLEYLDGTWLIKIKGKGDRDRRLPVPARLQTTWSDWFRKISEDAPRGKLSDNPATWINWAQRNKEQPLLISSRALHTGKPLSSSELGRIIRKTGRRAGLINRISPHMLRASAITHALDQGASHRGVQQMAGWTSPLMITRYDKRRKDPRFSAVLHLKYAKEVLS
jgi:integrase/recombinase XerC